MLNVKADMTGRACPTHAKGPYNREYIQNH